ncbi:MBL fold metallo-hydrolase [Euzebya tangerina]|uniref:MBL fold metallo-hydrolase n=1 Tax=Euzebya tangerina TaxID=591198 RepID=UPI0013C2CC8D|nr:MBL fold metallo-hydrolase [Euzebya tangerina]
MSWDEPGTETVVPGVHRAPVPLPMDGLRAINVYVIEDGDGVTLIDAGWNDTEYEHPVAREAVDAGLAAAGAEMGDVNRILVTHVHYDHVGQATELVRAGAGGYWLGERDKPSFDKLTSDPLASRAERMALLETYGATELADRSRARKPMLTEPVDWDEPERWIDDGDTHTTAVGAFVAIATPGHTAGHHVFHLPERRLLFAGDHVLPRITPSIGLESNTNRLALVHFLESLAKIRNLDVDLVLPAHGAPWPDLAGRVDELVAHHDDRLAASRAAVGAAHTDGVPTVGMGTTAYDVAKALPWTRRQTAFADLDLFNQVLATWETAAHLELLVQRGDLLRLEDEVIRFLRPPGSP